MDPGVRVHVRAAVFGQLKLHAVLFFKLGRDVCKTNSLVSFHVKESRLFLTYKGAFVSYDETMNGPTHPYDLSPRASARWEYIDHKDAPLSRNSAV